VEHSDDINFTAGHGLSNYNRSRTGFIGIIGRRGISIGGIWSETFSKHFVIRLLTLVKKQSWPGTKPGLGGFPQQIDLHLRNIFPAAMRSDEKALFLGDAETRLAKFGGR
jgi:hypothetical protein